MRCKIDRADPRKSQGTADAYLASAGLGLGLGLKEANEGRCLNPPNTTKRILSFGFPKFGPRGFLHLGFSHLDAFIGFSYLAVSFLWVSGRYCPMCF